MVLAPGGLADNLRISPLEPPETHRESNPRQSRSRRRATPFPDRYVIVNAQRKWCDHPTGSGQYFPVGIQDEMVFHFPADALIASLGHDGKNISRTRINPDVEIHCQRRSIKRRPKVGRSSRECDSVVGSSRSLRRHQSSAGVPPAVASASCARTIGRDISSPLISKLS